MLGAGFVCESFVAEAFDVVVKRVFGAGTVVDTCRGGSRTAPTGFGRWAVVSILRCIVAGRFACRGTIILGRGRISSRWLHWIGCVYLVMSWMGICG